MERIEITRMTRPPVVQPPTTDKGPTVPRSWGKERSPADVREEASEVSHTADRTAAVDSALCPALSRPSGGEPRRRSESSFAPAPVIPQAKILAGPRPTVYIRGERHTRAGRVESDAALQKIMEKQRSGEALVLREGVEGENCLDGHLSSSANFAVVAFVELARSDARSRGVQVDHSDISIKEAEARWLIMFAADGRLQAVWKAMQEGKKLSNTVVTALNILVGLEVGIRRMDILNSVLAKITGKPELLRCAKLLAQSSTLDAAKKMSTQKRYTDLHIDLKTADNVIANPLDDEVLVAFVTEIAIRWRNHDWIEVIAKAYEGATTQTSLVIFCGYDHAAGLRAQLVEKYPDMELLLLDAR